MSEPKWKCDLCARIEDKPDDYVCPLVELCIDNSLYLPLLASQPAPAISALVSLRAQLAELKEQNAILVEKAQHFADALIKEIARAEAAEAQLAEERAKQEGSHTWWMIELPQDTSINRPTRWFMGDWGAPIHWTSDPNEAVHFSRRRDAMEIIAGRIDKTELPIETGHSYIVGSPVPDVKERAKREGEETRQNDAGAWYWIKRIRARNPNHHNSWVWSNKDAARRLDEYFRQLCKAATPAPDATALREAANRMCSVCEGFYEHTECGGTREKPYRPDHCRFRAALLRSEPRGEAK